MGILTCHERAHPNQSDRLCTLCKGVRQGSVQLKVIHSRTTVRTWVNSAWCLVTVSVSAEASLPPYAAARSCVQRQHDECPGWSFKMRLVADAGCEKR